ncbi:MAG: hypothetical protein QNJ63_29090 [Calothrix sp. MO_192.B10]|nr:hypothetical protein [Calothrix sp. MO_192.B10]
MINITDLQTLWTVTENKWVGGGDSPYDFVDVDVMLDGVIFDVDLEAPFYSPSDLGLVITPTDGMVDFGVTFCPSGDNRVTLINPDGSPVEIVGGLGTLMFAVD